MGRFRTRGLVGGIAAEASNESPDLVRVSDTKAEEVVWRGQLGNTGGSAVILDRKATESRF